MVFYLKSHFSHENTPCHQNPLDKNSAGLNWKKWKIAVRYKGDVSVRVLAANIPSCGTSEEKLMKVLFTEVWAGLRGPSKDVEVPMTAVGQRQ